MRRATHYGVAADKQEVEHLRSEVARLRSHIGDMGDKIDQLTSLVETLAVEGSATPPATVAPCGGGSGGGSGGAIGVGVGIGGGSSGAGGDGGGSPGVGGGGVVSLERRWAGGEGDGLHGVGIGLGQLSFAGCSDQEEEDARFLPPPVPAGACIGGGSGGDGGDAASAAFLPLHYMSRKRKLVIVDQNCGGGSSSGGGGVGATAMWPAGSAAGSTIVKQEVGSFLPVKQEIVPVKQELMSMDAGSERVAMGLSCAKQEAVAAAAVVAWPPHKGGNGAPCAGSSAPSHPQQPQQATFAAAATAAISTAAIVPAVLPLVGGDGGVSGGAACSHSGSNSNGNSEFLQGFTDQFLSFESPTASYILPDRASESGGSGSGSGSGGGGGEKGMVRSSSSNSITSCRRNSNSCNDSSNNVPGIGCALAEGSAHTARVAGEGRGDAVSERGDSFSGGGGDKSRVEEEDDIDVCGDGGYTPVAEKAEVKAAVAKVTATAAAVAAAAPTAIATPVARSERSPKGAGEVCGGVARRVLGPPRLQQQQKQQQGVEEANRGEATSPLPLCMEELHDNLESLPAHSKTKVGVMRYFCPPRFAQ